MRLCSKNRNASIEKAKREVFMRNHRNAAQTLGLIFGTPQQMLAARMREIAQRPRPLRFLKRHEIPTIGQIPGAVARTGEIRWAGEKVAPRDHRGEIPD
jgi:hypothetical protein